jgi:hypothetical protein
MVWIRTHRLIVLRRISAVTSLCGLKVHETVAWNAVHSDTCYGITQMNIAESCGKAVRGCALFAVAMLLLSVSGASQQRAMNEWQLNSQHISDSRLKAVFGPLDGTIIGLSVTDKAVPYALYFDGNSKAQHRVRLSSGISGVELPEQTISVEAWVKVDEPLEWGGICNVIQDNGDHERGWLLGFRKSNFCFAVSSEGKKKLTYLTDPRSFEHGFWYHVVGTYDGQAMSLYVDGKLRAVSRDQSGPIAYPAKAEYTIGAYIDDDECHVLTGHIEQVSVFDQLLSTTEVARRFESRVEEFPQARATLPEVVDWPTYRRDSQRTGMSAESLQLPLHLQWSHQCRHPPQPAWPPPAENDFWNRKYNLKPRVTFDRAFHSVCVGESLFFG